MTTKNIILKMSLHYSNWKTTEAKKLVSFQNDITKSTRELVLDIVDGLSNDDFMEDMTISQVIILTGHKHAAVIMEDSNLQGNIEMFAILGYKFKKTCGSSVVFDDDFDMQETLTSLSETSDENIKRRPFGCGY